MVEWVVMGNGHIGGVRHERGEVEKEGEGRTPGLERFPLGILLDSTEGWMGWKDRTGLWGAGRCIDVLISPFIWKREGERGNGRERFSLYHICLYPGGIGVQFLISPKRKRVPRNMKNFESPSFHLLGIS